MPRPDPRRPRIGQLGIFEDLPHEEPDKVLRGRHSDAMDAAIMAARDQGAVDDVDAGILTVLRAGAWALDLMERRNQSYGPAKLIDPMLNALREARLTPDSRAAAADDAITDLISRLGQPDDECTAAS